MGGVFNRQQSGQTPGTRTVSAFRAALLARGHGEWAFHADGRHVRVARDAPLQLSSVNPFVLGTPDEIAESPVVVATDDEDDIVLRRFEADGLAGDTLEVFALASAAP
jgi:hypothetical protein